MDHIAIDWGGRESQVCVLSDGGALVEERRVATAGLGDYLRKRAPGRVVIEASSGCFVVADAAKEHGHEVRVVPSTLVKALGVGARRIKTDRRDARALGEASCRIDLPSVHVPSQESRTLKTVCGMRNGLVRSRTMLVNCVRGWLRGLGRTVRATPETLPARLRMVFAGLPDHVERLLETIEVLNRQISAATRELQKTANADPVCRRLMSVPGVGPVTALRFKSVLDEHGRFPSAHRVESYLGLVPGEHSSSERKHRLSITKAGSPELRTTLIQAAWSSRNARGQHPMVDWSYEVEKRRGKYVAIVALARKIAGILFALWRDETTYQATRGAAAI